jgi:hypothetical protein
VGKRDIKKLFVLPSFRNRNNSDYHDKIYHHFMLPFNQKLRHFSLSLKFSPPKVILIRMLKHNADKREVFQAHVAQVETLQNELESSKAQLTNLKNKSFQPVSHTQPIQGSRSREGPPRSFYGLSHDAFIGEYVLSNAHNFSLTPEFATSFCHSYFVPQEVSVAPKVSTISQIIHTDGLASSSSPITRARGV